MAETPMIRPMAPRTMASVEPRKVALSIGFASTTTPAVRPSRPREHGEEHESPLYQPPEAEQDDKQADCLFASEQQDDAEDGRGQASEKEGVVDGALRRRFDRHFYSLLLPNRHSS